MSVNPRLAGRADADEIVTGGPRLKVVIAGASGLIGQALVNALSGHEVVALNRSAKPQAGARVVQWDGASLGSWERELEGADALVNLAGAPVTLKWTKENKRLITESRVHTTEMLSQAVAACNEPPKVWVNGSAVGFYGDTGDTTVDEAAPSGKGFLPELCLAWERAVDFAPSPTRKVLLRTGVVLSNHGGAFPPLLKLAKLFLGGPAGKGKQWMPWIHIEDEVRLIQWCFDNDVRGPVNACAPLPVQNSELMRLLRSLVRRPWSPPVPEFALRVVGKTMGPDPEVVLMSSKVLPTVAMDGGFAYSHPMLEEALSDLVESAN